MLAPNEPSVDVVRQARGGRQTRIKRDLGRQCGEMGGASEKEFWSGNAWILAKRLSN